ncbi:unnamed protein product [Chrysoparadoxa australica]
MSSEITLATQREADPLVFVSSYTTFSNLAHAPRGTPAKHGISVYRLHKETGTLTLLTVNNDLQNPSFFRYHPKLNVLYTCTESIKDNDTIASFAVSPTTGQLTPMGSQSAEGKSTCYLTVDIPQTHMLFVNYWDSVIGTMPVDGGGRLSAVSHKRKPHQPVVARDLQDHLDNRQLEPHAHAIVLDPYWGRGEGATSLAPHTTCLMSRLLFIISSFVSYHFLPVALVPDLGEDDIKQYVYDEETGELHPTVSLPCGHKTDAPHGPRYLAFHPSSNIVYVVNELSSTVSVFTFNAAVAHALQPGSQESTLEMIQSISTIPSAFPKHLNTCGRICVDPTGKYVLVSNRGHDSIAVFEIDNDSDSCGEGGKLSIISFTHTRGRTPRHFQFDPSGEFLISANQDNDTLSIFRFDNSSGLLKFTGETYDVCSPNFVAIIRYVHAGSMSTDIASQLDNCCTLSSASPPHLYASHSTGHTPMGGGST